MAALVTGVLLLLWQLCHLTSSASPVLSADSDMQQQVDPSVLTEALKEMFGLHHIPASSSAAVQGHLAGDGGDAANFLMTLYDRVKDGASLNYKHTPANTVRAVVPTTEIIDGQLMYIFNVTNFVSHQYVFGGELHVMRKRAGSTRHVVIQMSSLGCPSLELDPLQPVNQTGDWQVVDVTRQLVTCLDRASLRRYGGTGVNLLTMTSFFLGSTPNQQATPINKRKIDRYLSKPFLVVYLNESQTINQDHVEPRLKPEGAESADVMSDGEGGAFYNPETGTLEYYGTALTVADEQENSESSVNTTQQTPRDVKEKLKTDDDKENVEKFILRKRRSTLDNEIPEIPTGEQHAGSHPKIYHPPYPQSKPKPSREKNEGRRLTGGRGSVDKDTPLLPHPSHYSQSQSLRNVTQNKKVNKKIRKSKKKQLFQSPAPWTPAKNGPASDNDVTGSDLGNLCARRRLVIDFADIGWSEWMISPRSFDAHYCAGSCPFPIPQRLRPSNHATIQSLVSALGVYPGVPGPCCVPDSMTSVTLLYFDDNKNVVLKNYPAMSVKTCACK